VASRLSRCRATSKNGIGIELRHANERYLRYLYVFDMKYLRFSLATANANKYYLLSSLLPVGRAEILRRRGNAEKA
jgi:hypothetical protein